MPTIRMSSATRLFLAGNTVSMLGTGLVIAFILIYLHQVRGVALPVVGGLLTASAGAGLLVVPLVGILLDRIGARRVLTRDRGRPGRRSGPAGVGAQRGYGVAGLAAIRRDLGADVPGNTDHDCRP